MILTNRSFGTSMFAHHSVGLANIEYFAEKAGPAISYAGLDAAKVINQAKDAAINGLISSAEAAKILGSAATYFFETIRPGCNQYQIFQEALAGRASQNV